MIFFSGMHKNRSKISYIYSKAQCIYNFDIYMYLFLAKGLEAGMIVVKMTKQNYCEQK